MLELVNLSCQRGERRLFSDLNKTVPPGRVVAVTGNNGSGKTSLLRMLCGLLPPEQGSILWERQNITALKEAYTSNLLYIGHLNGLKEDLTAIENLQAAAHLCGELSGSAASRDALAAIGLGHRVHDLPVRILSQGQKRRVALARVWLSTRRLWILDEPFASLDECAAQLLTQRFQAHVNSGGTVIVATHEEVGVASDCLEQMRLAG